MNLTDTHCHLDLEAFDLDRLEVLDRAFQAGLTRILMPGINLDSSKKVIGLAKNHPELFAAIGVHPNDATDWTTTTGTSLKQLYQDSFKSLTESPINQKIVAIGEIGLDYYWNSAPHELQKRVLKEQLALAAELSLPVILHMREHSDAIGGQCAMDLLEILDDWVENLIKDNNPLVNFPGVLHSFSGNQETAQKALDLNFFIGITGPVTYKNAESKREVVKTLPLDHVLIETDSPFLAPIPKRGHRNEPAFVCYIADKIAEIHNKIPEEIAVLTSANAARLFSWGG